MQCFVYKGDHKDDYYLYLDREFDTDDLPDNFPQVILGMLGDLNLVLDFELTAERKLPQADAKHVINDIQERGFYLQMPKKDMRALEDQLFS